MSASPTIHAGCVVIGEAGVLIRGRSGAGKSTLALALIDAAARENRFGRLVADDRTRIEVLGGRLVASAPKSIAGLMEVRGLGVLRMPYLAAAVVKLVVDLVDAPDRIPERRAMRVTLAGVNLPRLAVASTASSGVLLVSQALLGCVSHDGCGVAALAFAPQHGKLDSSAAPLPHLRSDRASVARGGHDPERKTFCAETA